MFFELFLVKFYVGHLQDNSLVYCLLLLFTRYSSYKQLYPHQSVLILKLIREKQNDLKLAKSWKA